MNDYHKGELTILKPTANMCKFSQLVSQTAAGPRQQSFLASGLKIHDQDFSSLLFTASLYGALPENSRIDVRFFECLFSTDVCLSEFHIFEKAGFQF
jgi:hypothetical protein